MDQLQPGVTGTAYMPPNPPVIPSAASSNSQTTAANVPNIAKLRALGTQLAKLFTTYENNRRSIEQKWMRNLRQFLGEYDPEVLRSLDKNRSQAYPRLTRIKCVSMLSRLMNLLFPTTEKNWGLEASPVPNLSMEDLTKVLQQAQQGAAQNNAQLSDEIIEAAVRAFAAQRAKNLETEIEDQLGEVGGNRNLSYVSLCRRVLFSGILYGCGVLYGPFVRKQMQRVWEQSAETGNYAPKSVEAYRPQLQFVSIWDYYPDMTAKNLHQMDGQFQRMVMSMSQLRELADRDDFFSDEITDYIRANPNGNWKEKTFENELRTMGVQSNVGMMANKKFEILIWDGFVSSLDLASAGIEMPAGDAPDMVDASVWLLGDRVIKCNLSPWAELEPNERVSMYHHFVFEEDDSSIIGNALPNIMRDSQMSVAAASRMLLDNASIVCGPNVEINTSMLRADQDMQAILPYKIWYRDDANTSPEVPAIREIKFDAHIAELTQVVELFSNFADQETFVNPATGGDMQKGPSEPFRTAAGASMIQGQAALPFKDVVRNFDTFTISIIHSVTLFNKHFNTKAEVKGDFTPVARGSSSLIAKEVRGMALDNFAATAQPEERKYINWYKLAGERVAVRDVSIDEVLVDADTAKQIDAAAAAKQQRDEAKMDELMTAEVRKLLADAVKSLTAADSNTASAGEKDANAEATKYNAILTGLESGVTPKDVHAAHQGGDIPAPIARGFRLKSGKDKPPMTSVK